MIFRDKHTKNYTPVSNELIRDTSIPPESRMLLIFALSHPRNWNMRTEYVMANFGWSEYKTHKAMRGLIQSGHLHRKKLQNGRVRYDFHETAKTAKTAPESASYNQTSKIEVRPKTQTQKTQTSKIEAYIKEGKRKKRMTNTVCGYIEEKPNVFACNSTDTQTRGGVAKRAANSEKAEKEKKEQGKDFELEPVCVAATLATPRKPKRGNAKSAAVWESYASAYRQRYGINPVRNANVNAILCKLVDDLGQSLACDVVSYYLQNNDAWFIKKAHDLQTLLANLQSVVTQCRTGQTITTASAREKERTSANFDVARRVMAKLERENCENWDTGAAGGVFAF